MRLSKNEITLGLSSSLLKVLITDDHLAVTMNARDHKLKAIELNNNQSNKFNREILWKAIGNSRYMNEWQQLL